MQFWSDTSERSIDQQLLFARFQRHKHVNNFFSCNDATDAVIKRPREDFFCSRLRLRTGFRWIINKQEPKIAADDVVLALLLMALLIFVAVRDSSPDDTGLRSNQTAAICIFFDIIIVVVQKAWYQPSLASVFTLRGLARLRQPSFVSSALLSAGISRFRMTEIRQCLLKQSRPSRSINLIADSRPSTAINFVFD